jgi:hypothetical protein
MVVEESKMSNTELSREGLIYKLAALESELGQAQRRLEATKKVGWCKKFWGTVAVAVLVLVLVLGAVAWGERVSGFCTGNTYLKFDDHAQVGYVMGVSDAFSLIASNPTNTKLFDSLSTGMSPKQVHAVVEKYMKDNPQEWHDAMAAIVYLAVVKLVKSNPPGKGAGK